MVTDDERIEELYDIRGRLYFEGKVDSEEYNVAEKELREIQQRQADAWRVQHELDYPMPVMRETDPELLTLARAILADKKLP